MVGFYEIFLLWDAYMLELLSLFFAEEHWRSQMSCLFFIFYKLCFEDSIICVCGGQFYLQRKQDTILQHFVLFIMFLYTETISWWISNRLFTTHHWLPLYEENLLWNVLLNSIWLEQLEQHIKNHHNSSILKQHIKQLEQHNNNGWNSILKIHIWWIFNMLFQPDWR